MQRRQRAELLRPELDSECERFQLVGGNKDRNWVIGPGVDWPATERLMVKGSILYYQTDGSAEFNYYNANIVFLRATYKFDSLSR